MSTCCNSGKNIAHAGIQFTGIRLSGYREAGIKSHFFSDHFICFFTSLFVALKQFKETCLCSRCSFGTKKFHMGKHMIQIFQIHHKFLHPKCRTFSDGRRLCRLKMRKGKRRKIFILHRKLRKFVDNIDQFLLNQFQSFCHNDNVCVISDITGGRTKVNDSGSFRTLLSIRIHMAHYIVAHFLFTGFCHIIIDIIDVRFQFFNLLICDTWISVGIFQSQFFFRFCQGNPQFSPCGKFHIL